jgi:hypothetical protein
MSVIQERMIAKNKLHPPLDWSMIIIKNLVTRKVCLENREKRGLDYS